MKFINLRFSKISEVHYFEIFKNEGNSLSNSLAHPSLNEQFHVFAIRNVRVLCVPGRGVCMYVCVVRKDACLAYVGHFSRDTKIF